MGPGFNKSLVIKAVVVIILIFAVAALKIAGAIIPAALVAVAGTAALIGIFVYQFQSRRNQDNHS
jgi:hypothetical membrane protein